MSLRGGGFWGPALWPCQEVLYWDEGGTERRAHHEGHRLSPTLPQPRSPPSPQPPPSPGVQQGWAKPPGWFWLGGSPAVPSGAGSGRCRLLHPAGPQLTGSPGAVGLCGVPGAAPGPAPGGRTLAAGVADSAFGPRRSFCLSSAGLRTQFAAEKGPGGAGGGAAPSPQPSRARCLPTQSCASSEDDSVSFRSRAASCLTDSTSEDALSIRSEMIQRKGARLGGLRGWGVRAEGVRGVRGAGEPGRKPGGLLGSEFARPQASAGIWGPLGRRKQLGLSQRLLQALGWDWARGTDGRTDAASSLLGPCGCLAAAEASLGCAGCLSSACPRASRAAVLGTGLGVLGGPGPGPTLCQLDPAHASHRFHLPSARLLRQIFGEGWQEEEGEEDNGAGHPPACPEGAG